MDLLHLYSCLSGTVYMVEQYVTIKKTKCCQHISFSLTQLLLSVSTVYKIHLQMFQ